ncbi:hypothetical protein [Actinomyces howellii]|uniref:Lipid A core - O-antigen ligase and related enzymes n=1 Tax=Actinomyces howellii TaxID=52771 RepID=A0A448HJ05_9ACTO|nr:hypothetical protein [Actinomyces howellii]VEG29660.1 Uncharacterised protein [Actinomyces howellii]
MTAAAPAAQGARPSPTGLSWEAVAAAIMAALVAMRTEVAGGIVVGDCAALVLLPVTWTAVRRSRGFTWLLVVAALAVVAGWVLSLAAVGEFTVLVSARRSVLLLAAGLPAVVATLVWASRRLSLRGAVAAFGVGMVIDNLSLLQTSPNPWKFGLGVAVAVTLTALTQGLGRPVQATIAGVLAVSFLLADSRATSGFMLLIMALLVWQAVAATLPVRHWSPARLRLNQSLLVAGMTLAAVTAVVAASLSGYLGQDAQARTAAQAAGTTNPFLAARPELGASWALLTHRPWGYGAGVMPRYEDVRVAMNGMKELGYNPDNGYVQQYMFGNGFELHSGLVDAWIALSVPGAALMVLGVLMALRALRTDLGTLRTRAWLLIAVLVTIMNVLVGPLTILPPFLAIVMATALEDEPRAAPTTPSPVRRSARPLPGGG